MNTSVIRASLAPTVAVAVAALWAPALPAADNTELLRRIEVLEHKLEGMQELKQELQALKQQLAQSRQQELARAKQKERELRAINRKLAETRRKAESEDSRTIKWHLAGYGTADYTSTDAQGAHDNFTGGEFNPIFLVSYRDLLQWESELEFTALSDGKTKTELEFSNLSLNVADWLTLVAGKFLSPIGDFQQHLHPSWINKLPDRPAGFVEDSGNEPLTEVGVMARGAVPVGSMTVEYAVFGGNGPRLSDVPEEGVLLEGFAGGDDNGDKAFGGRIGLRPLPYLSVGVSGMHSRVRGNPGAMGPTSTANYDLQDVDFAFTRGFWDVRGEYIRAHLGGLFTGFDPANPTMYLPATTWHAWYAQAAYRLAGIAGRLTSSQSAGHVLGNFEPVFRYSSQDVHGFTPFKANEEDRWTIGLNYWFAPSVVFKAAYENRNFRRMPDANEFRAQLAFGF